MYFYKWLKCLDTQFNETTNQDSMEVPKVDRPTNKKDFWGHELIYSVNLFVRLNVQIKLSSLWHIYIY